ncbi:hypothetical protein FXB39_18675 [Nocardioides sp. BGMRC 2183]|nr:hypothetical protein FXB39_18675 [Nocardioides sp. BGMRC 2183]
MAAVMSLVVLPDAGGAAAQQDSSSPTVNTNTITVQLGGKRVWVDPVTDDVFPDPDAFSYWSYDNPPPKVALTEKMDEKLWIGVDRRFKGRRFSITYYVRYAGNDYPGTVVVRVRPLRDPTVTANRRRQSVRFCGRSPFRSELVIGNPYALTIKVRGHHCKTVRVPSSAIRDDGRVRYRSYNVTPGLGHLKTGHGFLKVRRR